jgi:Flp pilus assembly protein TadG
MNYSRSNHKYKTRAQAMVEFALALPLLLLLVFGLMETGRLLFIYASTVSAAREAVRYGAAMGKNASNVSYYQDCAGIKKAAQNVGFINRFNDADILITYDGGLNDTTGAMIDLIPPGPSCGSYSSVKNGDRIKVSVSTQWVPIVSIVPFKGFTITSSSERTIIASISISAPIILSNADKTATAVQLTKIAQTFVAATLTQAALPTSTLTPTASSTPLPSPTNTATPAPQPIILFVKVTNPEPLKAGDLITFDYTIQNINGFSITNLLLTATGNGSISFATDCPATIPASSSVPCKGTRLVTQTEINTGAALTNSVTANGFAFVFVSVTSNAVQTSVSITQSKALSISSLTYTLSSSTLVAGSSKINYVYTLKNTGNVTLSNPTVSDDKATITCSSANLLPGATRECTGSHTVTQDDFDAGSVINIGTAQAIFGGVDYFSSPASTTVTTSSFTLAVTQGQTTLTPADLTVRYTYRLTNNGNTVLSKPYTITSSLQTTLLIAGTGGSNTTNSISPSCNSASNSIKPGQSTTCTYTYTHPSTTGSSTIANSSFAVSIGARPAATIVPIVLNATAYNCTSSNFTVSNMTSGSSNNILNWVITNMVGIDLPINSVKISWQNDGKTSDNKYQLDGININNSSTLSSGTIPDSKSSHTSGSGTLTGSSSAGSVTTISFTFGKSNPIIDPAIITIDSPYDTCTRTWNKP